MDATLVKETVTRDVTPAILGTTIMAATKIPPIPGTAVIVTTGALESGAA